MNFPKWTNNLEMGYGSAYSSGWAGLGVYFYDPTNYQVVWFEDVLSCNTHDEYSYNELMRYTILDFMGELDTVPKEDR